jgi:hypothetical protein
MANVDAFNSGFNSGFAKSKKKKDSKKDGASDAKSDTGMAKPSSFAKGGKVKKTGKAEVHKGEIVLTAAQGKMCASKRTKKKGARKRITTKA